MGLVVSALNAATIGKTRPGRVLKSINIPSKLNNRKVIDEILGMKDCKDEDLKSILMSLVSTVTAYLLRKKTL